MLPRSLVKIPKFSLHTLKYTSSLDCRRRNPSRHQDDRFFYVIRTPTVKSTLGSKKKGIPRYGNKWSFLPYDTVNYLASFGENLLMVG